jgi:hypothetical protein
MGLFKFMAIRIVLSGSARLFFILLPYVLSRVVLYLIQVSVHVTKLKLDTPVTLYNILFFTSQTKFCAWKKA